MNETRVSYLPEKFSSNITIVNVVASMSSSFSLEGLRVSHVSVGFDPDGSAVIRYDCEPIQSVQKLLTHAEARELKREAHEALLASHKSRLLDREYESLLRTC